MVEHALLGAVRTLVTGRSFNNTSANLSRRGNVVGYSRCNAGLGGSLQHLIFERDAFRIIGNKNAEVDPHYRVGWM